MHNTQILRIADFDQIFYSNVYVPTSRQGKKNIEFPANFSLQLEELVLLTLLLLIVRFHVMQCFLILVLDLFWYP